MFLCAMSYSGSKLVIEGHNLDSAHRTVVQYTPQNRDMQPIQEVSSGFKFLLVEDLPD